MLYASQKRIEKLRVLRDYAIRGEAPPIGSGRVTHEVQRCREVARDGMPSKQTVNKWQRLLSEVVQTLLTAKHINTEEHAVLTQAIAAIPAESRA